MQLERHPRGQDMTRFVRAVYCLVLLAGITGCGGKGKVWGQDGESLMQEEIRLTIELADALENGADQAVIDELDKKLAANSKKFEAVPQAERDRLTQKYASERGKAGMRAATARLKKQGISVRDYTPKSGQK
jgi:hypothetical protein